MRMEARMEARELAESQITLYLIVAIFITKIRFFFYFDLCMGLAQYILEFLSISVNR